MRFHLLVSVTENRVKGGDMKVRKFKPIIGLGQSIEIPRAGAVSV